MRPLAPLFVLGALLASPAAAAGWVSCSDAGGLASFDYFVAESPDKFVVSAVTVTAGERVWASDPANGPGDPIYVGQYHQDELVTLVGALDQIFIPVAELRLIRTSEAGMAVLGGTLRIIDVGAWVVSCDQDSG